MYQNVGSDPKETGHGLAKINNSTGRKASPLFISFHKIEGVFWMYALLIPSKISESRRNNKPVLSVEVSGGQNSNSFSVFGNEDFESLKALLRQNL